MTSNQVNRWVSPIQGALLSADRRVLVLNISKPEKYTQVFPASNYSLFRVKKETFIALPYKAETLQILRNLGCNTSGLELLRHTFTLPKVEETFDLMPHQVTTAAFFIDNKRSFCTSTMRTGKTASAVTAARYLQVTGKATAFLIICTVSNIWEVWEKEIKGLYPDAIVRVLHEKSKAERCQLLNQDADFYIINYDGVKMLTNELSDAVETGRISGCIIDEVTHYANKNTQLWDSADQVINGVRWKVTEPRPRIMPDGTTVPGKPKRARQPDGKSIEYVWGLTGTPGDVLMVYGQVKLINPRKMPCSYTYWRDSNTQKVNFKYIPLPHAKQRIFETMQPCIRFDKKDIMKLPPVTIEAHHAPLSTEQISFYDKLKQDMIALSDSGNAVVATTKGVLVTKLFQIAGGVVVGQDAHIALDIKPRIEELVKLIKTATQKVVIFCAYTAITDRVHDELVTHGYHVGVVDGRVTGKKRTAVFSEFQNGKDMEVIICHPKTTAFGTELSAADLMIFFGPPMSGEFVYQQAIERLSSLKQKAESVRIIQFSSTPEERRMFSNIRHGVSMNEAINEMFTYLRSN